jgi:dTDP-4-dehydrorhamnose reductase
MNKKILVLGANGMAGHVITIGLRESFSNYDVISVARSNSLIKPTFLLDISNFIDLEKLIHKVVPDIIINCIGLLNKNAEDNPEKAILINSYLPHFLESITKLSKIKIIHISTDCVFSGKEGNYLESSFKNGVGFYAQSKALGEIINNKDLTIRTSIIGPEINNNGIGLFHWYYNQTGQISGYTNALWTGVTTIELLRAINASIKENLTGLYHLVNNQKISKYDLLNIINDEFKRDVIILKDSKYKIDKSLLNTRSDFSFRVKEYRDMLTEVNKWVKKHKIIYPHYNIISTL